MYGGERHTCVPGGSDLGFGQAVIGSLAVPKVCDLDQGLGGCIKQGVLQLNIPVHHPHPVTVVQSHNELLEEPPCILLLSPAHQIQQSMADTAMSHSTTQHCWRSCSRQEDSHWCTCMAHPGA